MRNVLLKFFTNRFQPQPLRNGIVKGNACPQQTAVWRKPVPAFTDLRTLHGQRVLIVLDSDNLDYSLERQGTRLRYAKLLSQIGDRVGQVFPVAVLTSAQGDQRRADFLARSGWRVVSIPWENVITYNGVRKMANADLDIAFEFGCLASISGCDAALIGTGDGDLAVSIARGLRRTRPRTSIAIHALSVAGATSARLRQRNDLFDSNVIVGTDMLEDVATIDERKNRFEPKGGSNAC
jgi:hypothetical protein